MSYKDKINISSDENPIMRDRLQISPSRYGYSMYDRKIKKHLFINKSKETCIKGRDILHESGFEEFKSFWEDVKDEVVVTNKILITYGKYGDSYYSVPTIKELHKVSIHLLEERIELGYFRKGSVTESLDYTEEDVEKMPESFRADALKKLKYNKSFIAGDLEFNKDLIKIVNKLKKQ